MCLCPAIDVARLSVYLMSITILRISLVTAVGSVGLLRKGVVGALSGS